MSAYLNAHSSAIAALCIQMYCCDNDRCKTRDFQRYNATYCISTQELL